MLPQGRQVHSRFPKVFFGGAQITHSTIPPRNKWSPWGPLPFLILSRGTDISQLRPDLPILYQPMTPACSFSSHHSYVYVHSSERHGCGLWQLLGMAALEGQARARPPATIVTLLVPSTQVPDHLPHCLNPHVPSFCGPHLGSCVSKVSLSEVTL